MKKFSTILLICIATAFVSCERRHIDDNMYDPSVYILNSGLQETETFFDVEGTSTYTVNTFCGGLKDNNPQVKIAVNESLIEGFNEENKTEYVLLPESCYSLDATTKSMSDKKANFVVTFDCNALKSLSETEDYSDLANYILPLSVSSMTDGVTDSRFDDKKTIFLVPEMVQMGFTLEEAGQTEITLNDLTSDETGNYYVFEYNLKTPVENKWNNGVTFNFNIDPINADYPKLPEGSYTISSTSDAGFTPGLSEIKYTVTVDKSKLLGLYYSFNASVASEGEFIVVGEDWSEFDLNNYNVVDQSTISWDTETCNSYVDSYTPAQSLDGNPATRWDCAWNTNANQHGATKLPFSNIYIMPEELNIVGFSISRRTDKYVTDLRGGYYEVSNDMETWTKVYTYDLGDKTNTSTGPFNHILDAPVKAKYVRFWMTTSNRTNSASIAEFNVFTR